MTDIKDIITNQKAFFYSGATKNINFRIEKLKQLYSVILKNISAIEEALYKDLNKSAFEAYETEIGIVLSEISFIIKNLRKWSKLKKVKAPLVHFPSKSYVYSEPYGSVLIMSPWNYPFQLCLIPLVGAIAAGNCCVLKPSKYSEETSLVVEKILNSVFEKNYVAVVQGGREENASLLNQRFDYIFFTGSPAVGHVVMESAAKFLTPVTLELGGKSPCIVDETADISLAAKRIIWGKLINCGQTCIAPDYIIVKSSIKDKLIKGLIFYIKKFYGEDPINSSYYPKIISKKHFLRLCNLMENENIIFGGNTDSKNNKINPTLIDCGSILDENSWKKPVMCEEIFGPLFPILTFDNYNNIISVLQEKEKPLALYLFSTNKKIEKLIMGNVSFGGGCINDTLIHITNNRYGFGGVGQSGIGQYHGKASFDTFSHKKGIMKKSNALDINIRYPPFNKSLKIIKKIMK